MPTRSGVRPAPVRGAARLLRGWSAAAVATLLAAGSHTLAARTAAGHLHPDAGPEPVIWILTLALAGPLCTALAGRPLSWWRLATGVSASQLLFHWLYSVAAVPAVSAGAGVLAGLDPHAGHAGHAVATSAVSGTSAVVAPSAAAAAAEVALADATLADATLPGASPGVAEALHGAPAMIAAHVLAVVGTVVLLRRGELLATRVAELAVGLILRSPGARVSRWTPTVPFRRPCARAVPLLRRPDNVLLPSLRLRGPPEPSRFALAA